MALHELWKRNWPRTLRNVWYEMVLDDCFGAAAQLAYYFLLAFLPFTIFLLALIAFLPIDWNIEHAVNDLLVEAMPAEVWSYVQKQVHGYVESIVGQQRQLLLMVSIVGALFVASNGMRALMVTLNRAYNVREGRPFWYRYALGVGLTIAFSITTIIAALSLSLANRIDGYVNDHWGPQWATVWIVFAKVLGFAISIYILELIYHLAPNVRRPWHWITPGSMVAVLLWFLAIKGFRLYVSFANFQVMYATLGVVVVSLLWLYIAGLAILVGGELNAELERSSGMLAVAAVPAPLNYDAAGHDITFKDHLPRSDSEAEPAPDSPAEDPTASPARRNRSAGG